MCDKLYRFCRSALWILLLLAVGAVFCLNIVYSAEVAYDQSEQVRTMEYWKPSLLMLSVLGILMVITAFFQDRLEKIDEQKLFRILCCIYSVFALYLILNVDNVLRADADSVHKAAVEINAGIYRALQPGEYLYRFHHQHGVVFYEMLLTRFSPNPAFLFLVNFLMVLGINHTSWKISEELFHDRVTNVLTITICFLFLPQLFFILFAYGLIPGLFFLLLGFLHTLKYASNGSISNLAGMTFFTAVAIVLKRNCMIGAIAMMIYLALQVLRRKNIRYFAGILMLAIFMIFPGKLICGYYSQKADVALDNPTPSILWLAMGSDIDNNAYGPGWYDHSVWTIYDEAEFDSEEASRVGVKKLQNNWNKIKAEPVRAIKFFAKKVLTLWCDPLYQSIWSGPMTKNGQETHTDFLRSIYTDNVWEDRIVYFSKFVNLAIWLFTSVFLIGYAGKQEGWELIYLYFLGGMLFHMFWEGKSQYIYPYVFCLIPFAACGCRGLLYKLKEKCIQKMVNR